ncbi:hypothetical protein B9J78_03885 [bacterium Unc6]|nr:hypothetical protein [bacterium Unc6]
MSLLKFYQKTKGDFRCPRLPIASSTIMNRIKAREFLLSTLNKNKGNISKTSRELTCLPQAGRKSHLPTVLPL